MKWTIIVTMVVFIFSGCAKQPISTSLTELGSVSKARYGHKNVPAIQSININGLGSADTIGTITYDPDRDTWRKYFDWFAEFPDTMAPRFTHEPSYILHTWSASETRGAEIALIKKALHHYQGQLAEYYRAQLVYDVLNQALPSIKDPEEYPRLRKALIQTGYIAEDASSPRSMDDELAILKQRASDLQNELNASIESFNKPGIVIARWETSSNVGTALDAMASSLNASAQREKNLQGFVILGEPHVVTLVFGKDFNASYENNAANAFDMDSTHVYITHHQLRAKQIAYTESSYQSLSMTLDADVSRLTQELGGFGIAQADIKKVVETLKVKLSMAYGQIASNTAEGFLSGNHSEKIVCNQKIANCLESVNDINTTLPVISSRISLEFFKGRNHE